MTTLLRQETKENLRNTAKESILILVYECIGTSFMTLLICNYYAQRMESEMMVPVSTKNAESSEYESKDQHVNIQPDNAGLLLGMFVTIMFSARISGSHFNPCITLSFMFGNVKQGKFDRILGVLYIVAQFSGAILGCIFAKFLYGPKNLAFKIEGNDML